LALDNLAMVINRTIERKGKVLIPAFAIERTQELIYHLHMLHDEKRIPKIPIYVDSPMSTNATSIFRVHQECYDRETREAFLEHHKNPFGFNDLRYITNVEESKNLNQNSEPAVIIASSGMCEGGRIVHHLKNNIQNPDNTVLIVGFMARGTLGRRIKEQYPTVKIFGKEYTLRAEVVTLNTFSAHADYNEILGFVGQLDKKKLKHIFLVHGEPEAQNHLKGLLKEKDYKTTIVRYNETYDVPL
jgi:metallo-beta-lactamase family protein